MGYNLPYSDGVVVDANYEYIYGDHYIIEDCGRDYYCYYTLNDDGLIVKLETKKIENDEGTTDYLFEYDDGRIISYEECKFNNQQLFHWEDGELMYYVQDNKEGSVAKTEFTRSPLSVDHGYMNPPLSTMREPLYMMGYYGKTSKHLESHFKKEGEGTTTSVLLECDYTYTIADGHVVKMVENLTTTVKMGMMESSSTKKNISTFTYEEY